MREGGKLKKREREIRGSETHVPKLYTYNEYEHSVISLEQGIEKNPGQMLSLFIEWSEDYDWQFL